jgi:GNAT superfamily N-acetyltransferase
MAMEPERSRGAIERYVVRELGPEHQAELVRLTQCLGPPFSTSKTLAPVNWSAGAFVNQHLRGFVEGRSSKIPSLIEISLIVEPAWRRRGLGGALLEAAVCWGKATGRSTLRMIFSRHDWPMRKLASKANARFDMVLDGMSADIILCAPSCPNINQTGDRNG